METKKALEILEKATKVILLTGTIREMDKYKDAGGNLGDNIRIISRKSREDEESQKYICVTGYERNHYQDDNIIDYCKKNLNAIILTNDNNLCNMAKAYGIPYIFPQDEGLQNIKGIIMKDGNLYLPKGKGEKVAPIETVEETTVDNEPVVEVPVAEEITTNIVAETTYDKFNVNMKYTNDDVLEITFPKNIGFKNVIDMGMKIKKAFSYDVVVKGRTLTIVFNSSKSEEDCYEIFTNIYRVINPTLRTLK